MTVRLTPKRSASSSSRGSVPPLARSPGDDHPAEAVDEMRVEVRWASHGESHIIRMNDRKPIVPQSTAFLNSGLIGSRDRDRRLDVCAALPLTRACSTARLSPNATRSTFRNAHDVVPPAIPMRGCA
jgi:hypothetical protein